MGKSANNLKHLLIIRYSDMGDVAMLAHVVRALRASCPELKISILTSRSCQPLFDGLDVNIIPVDIKREYSGVLGLRRLAKYIKSLDVDSVADMQYLLRTVILRTFLRLYGGVSLAHLFKDKVSKWMRMDGGCKEVTMPLKHTVERYCEVLRYLGFDLDTPTPIERSPRPNPMPYPKGDERWIGVAPFSAYRGKSYPLELIREVISQLSQRYDRVFIHSGEGAEFDFAQEMASRFEGVVAIHSKLALAKEIDLISNEDCIVTMDSPSMHLASLVATPVVSIWGATHPSLGFSGYGCNAEGYVQLELPCRPCSTYGNKRCRFGDYHCLSEITPESVVERVDYIVGADRERRAQ